MRCNWSNPRLLMTTDVGSHFLDYVRVIGQTGHGLLLISLNLKIRAVKRVIYDMTRSVVFLLRVSRGAVFVSTCRRVSILFSLTVGGSFVCILYILWTKKYLKG